MSFKTICITAGLFLLSGGLLSAQSLSRKGWEIESDSVYMYAYADTAQVIPGEPAVHHLSVSTNLADWVNLATTNVSFLYSTSRHSTFGGGIRYNPWKFKKGMPDQFSYGLFSVEADYRYWPWHVYSGWWLLADLQYRSYNYTKWLWYDHSNQGRAIGAGLGVGYTYMLGEHWNIEAGVSIWGGWSKYAKYQCGSCGKQLDKGNRLFAEPDRVFINISYIF